MFTKTGNKTSAKPNTWIAEQNGLKIYITGISSCGFCMILAEIISVLI